MHARWMLDRAECLANGMHTQSPAWRVVLNGWKEIGHLQPTELAEDLPSPRPHGERWLAGAGALQFAQILEEDGSRLVPASYVTSGSHDIFADTMRSVGSRRSLFVPVVPPIRRWHSPVPRDRRRLLSAKGMPTGSRSSLP